MFDDTYYMKQALLEAKKAKEKVSNDEAQKMVEKGEATIPPEAIVSKDEACESSPFEKDYEKHPKFSKFKKGEG